MKPARIEIVIDRLVLHGFSSMEQEAIGAALSQELQQLIAAGNPADLASLGSMQVLRADHITLAPGVQGQAIGSQLAKTVHGGLTK